jgi:hypothetical protein
MIPCGAEAAGGVLRQVEEAVVSSLLLGVQTYSGGDWQVLPGVTKQGRGWTLSCLHHQQKEQHNSFVARGVDSQSLDLREISDACF